MACLQVLMWEQMIVKIKHTEHNPRYGKPLYKGYATFEAATTELQKMFGNDYIISDEIQSLQNISLGKQTKQEIPESSTNISLCPQTSFATIIKIEPSKLTNLGKPLPIQ